MGIVRNVEARCPDSQNGRRPKDGAGAINSSAAEEQTSAATKDRNLLLPMGLLH
jgi:hypothetical protein